MHWIILDGERNTGVTLQTLHPTRFDAGTVLDQTPEPGVAIPDPTGYGLMDLQAISAKMTAKMLIKAIRERNFIPPHKDVRQVKGDANPRLASYAPKIDRKMRFVDFQTMSSSQVSRMNRAIAPLWAEAYANDIASPIAIIFSPALHVATTSTADGQGIEVIPSIMRGLPYVSLTEHENIDTTSAPILINTIDEKTLVIPTLKVSGTPFRPAAALAWNTKLLGEPSVSKRSQSNSSHPNDPSTRDLKVELKRKVYIFHHSLRAPQDMQEYLEKLWNGPERII